MKPRDCWFLCVAVASLALGLGGCGVASTDPAASYPSKSIEYVTHGSAGGAAYQVGEIIRDVVDKQKLLSQPVVVNIKAGSGAAVEFAYVLEKKSDAYLMAGYTGLLLTTPMEQKLPYSFKDFTPLAMLCADANVLVVNSKSPYKTVQDIIDDARKRPKQLMHAGSSLTSPDGLLPLILAKKQGVEWNFVPMGGGTEAVTAVLGGNGDFTMTNPTVVLDHIRAGNLRALMAGAPTRYSALPDVPTMKELGLGDPIMTPRGVMGPPGMPEYAQKKLEATLKKVSESEEFKKYLSDTMQVGMWMDSATSFKYLEEQTPIFKQAMTDAGVLK